MPRSASVEALTNVTVIKIDAEALDQASENCQLDFNQAFLRILVQRLMHADLRLAKVLS
jgi:CRP-like cAMP-binding protein